MKRFVIIFIMAACCIALSGSPAPADQAQSDFVKIFDRAANYYEKGLYDKAIEEYDSILNEGFEGGNIYYNLGNCYLKKGALGKAIVYYERARSLIPRDTDLLFNYKYAKSLIKQTKAPAAKILFFDAMGRAGDFFNLKETIVLTSVIYYLNIALIGIFIIFKKYRIYIKYALVTSAAMLLCGFIWSGHKIRDLDQGAIVIANIADAKFEPLEGASANFPVYEGTKIYILKARGDWYKIKLSDVDIGWMKKDAVEPIGR